jgi:hypothetical protein
MMPSRETAALVALLRTATKPWHAYAEAIEERASALTVLEEERGLFSRYELNDAAA